MRLRYLHYLVSISKEKNFGRAAISCGVTQSTLSSAIQKMENDLGVPLIERDKKFKRFTVEGEIFLDWARKVISEKKVLDEQIGSIRGELKGTISLGVIPTASPIVSFLTSTVSKIYPDISFKVFSQSSDEIYEMLDNFTLDIGITYIENEKFEKLKKIYLYTENYIFLTKRSDCLNNKNKITWKEASSYGLCLLNSEMQNRKIINDTFLTVNSTPNASIETNSVVTLYSHALTGIWSTILPSNFLYIFGEPKNMLSLPLVEPKKDLKVGMVIKNNELKSPLVNGFINSVNSINLDTIFKN